MYFIFSKLLLFLLKPLFWLFAALVGILFVKDTKKQKRYLFVLLLIAFLFSNTLVFNLLVKRFEAPYPNLAKYEYGLLLGGFSKQGANGDIAFNASADRVLQTLRLYKTGIIKKIIISSGSADLQQNQAKEADLLSTYFKQIGIPDTAVITENQSRNTIENLRYSSSYISQEKQVLVITSAWHIPRVKLIAHKLKLVNLAYYPSNSFYNDDLSWDDVWLPNPVVLERWGIILKELVGMFALKIGIANMA